MKPALRRLSLAESRNVAQQIATHAATIAAENLRLGAKTGTALQAVLAAGAPLQERTLEASFQQLDREVDGAFAALFRIVDGFERAFTSERVPLSAAANDALAAVRAVRVALDAYERRFVNWAYRDQYDEMRRIIDTLTTAELAPAVAAANLTLLVDRLAALTEAYGQGLGFLATKGEDATAALGPFLDALTKLLLHATSEHDSEDANDARVLALLEGPYAEAAERLRRDEAADRRRKKAKKDD
jgi:hypothetical protein